MEATWNFRSDDLVAFADDAADQIWLNIVVYYAVMLAARLVRVISKASHQMLIFSTCKTYFLMLHRPSSNLMSGASKLPLSSTYTSTRHCEWASFTAQSLTVRYRHCLWALFRPGFAPSEIYPNNLCVYAGLLNILCVFYQGLERLCVSGHRWILCSTSVSDVACSSYGMNPRPVIAGPIGLENMHSGRCFLVEAEMFYCIRNKLAYEGCRMIGTSRLKPCNLWLYKQASL